MIRTRMLIVVATLATAIPQALDAQGPPDPVRAERLRQMIEERFAEQLERQLGLSDEAAGRVRNTLFEWAGKRRDIERAERQLRQELAGQMRPGVAADEALVTRLTNQILDGRIAYVQTFKDELAALGDLLTPVQRAQYLLMRDRLMQRVQDIRGQRGGPPGMGRP